VVDIRELLLLELLDEELIVEELTDPFGDCPPCKIDRLDVPIGQLTRRGVLRLLGGLGSLCRPDDLGRLAGRRGDRGLRPGLSRRERCL